MNRRLYRSADDRVLAGVAGGIAETYDFDPALVRVAWALLIIFSGGALLILYIIMALVIPLAPDSLPAEGGYWPVKPTIPAEAGPSGSPGITDPALAGGPATTRWLSEREQRRMLRRERRGNGEMAGAVVFGLILILAGAFFLLRDYVPSINWSQIWPLGLIAIGAVLLLAAMFRRPASR
jgi:phage shock protein PspC (stress-responsive transcriptional regulator)